MQRKYVLKNKKRFAISILLTILILFVPILAASAYGDREATFDHIYIRRGDTLWDIAVKYRQKGDIRKYIKRVMEINNLHSEIIYEGDVLKIPK